MHTSSAVYVHDTGPIVTAKLRKGIHEHASTKVNLVLKIRHLPTDKKIRVYDYRSSCSRVPRNDPDVCSSSVRSSSKCSLDTSKERPETHEKCTDEKHGPATPFVNVDDGGNYENDW